MWIFLGRTTALPRRIRLGVPLVLGVLLVAGCTAGSLPRGLPTASGTIRASAIPTPSPTLSREDEAVEAVREYFKALDVAVSTGDTTAVALLSTASCTCRSVIDAVRKDWVNGGRVLGAHWTVDRIKFYAFDRSAAMVNVDETTSAYRTVNRAGRTTASYHARGGTVVVQLVEASGEWKIANLIPLVRQ